MNMAEALLRGDGVFETLRIYRGTPFAMRRHVERMARSAAGLRLPLPPAGELRQAMVDAVAAAGLDEGRLRITVAGTPDPLVMVSATPLDPWPPTADVAVVPWPRNERSAVAGLKTVSYAENDVALAWAMERNAGEAIFANTAGRLCEGAGSNVFLVQDGRLLTPPRSSGCLAGVTRELVLELVDAEEADLPVEALADVDEAFLTSSTREVQPIRAVDGRPLPAAPGAITNQTAAAFAELVARDLDP